MIHNVITQAHPLMGLVEDEGLLLHESDAGLAEHCLRLLNDPTFALGQSQAGCRQAHESFSFAATYGRLADTLHDMTSQRVER